MSLEDEWIELNNRYHAQREQIEYLESEVFLLSKQEERNHFGSPDWTYSPKVSGNDE